MPTFHENSISIVLFKLYMNPKCENFNEFSFHQYSFDYIFLDIKLYLHLTQSYRVYKMRKQICHPVLL